MEITSGSTVEIEIAGAVVTIPSNTIAELWLGKVRGADDRLLLLSPFPRIGASYGGGTFMGVVRGEKGEADYPVIDLGEAPERMSWEAAKKWAEEKGARLPTRREQALMFANRGDGQYKAEWYWSSAQYAGNEGYAWCQGFDSGSQGYYRKSGECRARAVRRLTIQ